MALTQKIPLSRYIINFIQYLSNESDILCFSITPTNIGQLSKLGTVFESARPELSNTVPESLIWPRFGWDNQGKRQ